MKIEKENLENHKVKLTVEFEENLLEGFKRKAARILSKDHKIPGFRPGKAPYDVIRRSFGDEAIEKQAIDLMLDDVYQKVLEEAEVAPSGPGNLENIVSTSPPVFEFSIPLTPEVELGDYKDIRIEYKIEPVTEDDVENVIKNIRTGYATAVPVERPAQEGDLVAIKIKGRLTQPEEGEDPEIVKESPQQVSLVDEENERAWPYAGFWKELVGLSKDDQKTAKYEYPEDTPILRFKEKEIEFEFTVENVKEMDYPEIDDEFAKSLGAFENLEEMRSAIQENLEKSRQEEYDQDYLTQVIDELIEKSTIKYAPNTLDEEIENVLGTVQRDLANQNLDLETYLKFKNTDRQTFLKEEIEPLAVRRLERSLIMDEIARAEEIEIQEAELRAGVTEAMAELFNTPGFKKPTTQKDIRQFTNLVSYDTAGRILNQKVQTRLRLIASGEWEAIQAEEAEAAAKAAAEAAAEVEVEAETEAAAETAAEETAEEAVELAAEEAEAAVEEEKSGVSPEETEVEETSETSETPHAETEQTTESGETEDGEEQDTDEKSASEPE